MPYTTAQKHLFGLCSSLAGRAKARGKCPPMWQAKKLAHEAASLPTRRKKAAFKAQH
jgi:hypothetical protein